MGVIIKKLSTREKAQPFSLHILKILSLLHCVFLPSFSSEERAAILCGFWEFKWGVFEFWQKDQEKKDTLAKDRPPHIHLFSRIGIHCWLQADWSWLGSAGWFCFGLGDCLGMVPGYEWVRSAHVCWICDPYWMSRIYPGHVLWADKVKPKPTSKLNASAASVSVPLAKARQVAWPNTGRGGKSPPPTTGGTREWVCAEQMIIMSVSRKSQGEGARERVV